jgi:hypothetical protein
MNRGLIHVAQQAARLDYPCQSNHKIIPLNFPNRGLNMEVGVVRVPVLDVVLLVEIP